MCFLNGFYVYFQPYCPSCFFDNDLQNGDIFCQFVLIFLMKEYDDDLNGSYFDVYFVCNFLLILRLLTQSVFCPHFFFRVFLVL